MKRLIPLACAFLLLGGCARLYPGEYLSVTPHVAPYAYEETAAPPVSPISEEEPPLQPVSYLSDIRAGIQKMIREGGTSARFLLQDYHDETANLADTVKTDLETYSPKYVYNAEIDMKTEQTSRGFVLNVNIRPGLTAKELRNVASRLYSNAMPLIYGALVQHKTDFMIEITGYVETDFQSILEDYALAHPDAIIEIPRISVTTVPESGSVRLIILEFKYKNDKETIDRQQEVVESMLDNYQNMYSEFDGPEKLLETTYKLLVPASGYVNRENATVYSLLLSKEGSSRMMAAVAAYLCSRAGKSCRIVKGEREGESWYWNQLQTETGSLYFDLHAAALDDTAPILMTAEELTGYSWDREQYPEVEAPEPEEPTEPEGPESTEETTEGVPETP